MIISACILAVNISSHNTSTNIHTFETVSERLLISNESVPEEHTPEIPEPPSQEVMISAWIAYWDLQGALTTYKQNTTNIHSLSPTWYFLQANGSLGLKNTARNQELIDLCKENGTELIPTISNGSATELSDILNDSELQQRHISAIVNEVLTQDYDGIDIDYEAIKKTDKNVFSDFIKNLAIKLGAHDKKLTIAILWKNEFAPVIDQFSESRAAQDWEEIGKHVDEFRIMGYDYTHSYDAAGPIAPKEWLESILVFAIGTVDSEKIVLGLPLYAYEWVEGSKGARALVWSDVQNIKTTHKSSIITNELNQEFLENQLVYNNGTINKVIWYQDSTATQKRVELAKTYGVFKFIFWRMGGEDTQIYNLAQ